MHLVKPAWAGGAGPVRFVVFDVLRRGPRRDRRGLLVHLLHRLRQPRPHVQRHLRRYRPASVPLFVVFQIIGGVLGAVVALLLFPDPPMPLMTSSSHISRTA
jgi:hypothetical protein